MPESMKGEIGQVSEICLDYGLSPWKTSSQRAAELYDSGAKLWRREDLVDIEEQLEESYTRKRFTVRRIDGSIIHITNPMFRVPKPLWKPRIKFQEYWHLVQSKPDGPPETYHCTYLLDLASQAVSNYDRPIENARLLFDTEKQHWDASMTCMAFTSQFRKLLEGERNVNRVTKIVCFGLGDLNFVPPDWWKIQNQAMPEDQREDEISLVKGPMVHHAVALTIANVVRSYTKPGDREVRLLTQDPGYCEATKDILKDVGFEVVGKYRVGGFAEIDDESVVFSPFVNAPVKQMISDLARPLVIILPKNTTGGVWNPRGKPWGDPESPRTRQMWEGYESEDFQVAPDSVQMEASLHRLELFRRIGENSTANK